LHEKPENSTLPFITARTETREQRAVSPGTPEQCALYPYTSVPILFQDGAGRVGMRISKESGSKHLNKFY